MNILLTGAKGFTGQHFIKAAQLAGHTTHILSTDIKDASAIRKAIENIDIDAVVHLAAISFVGHTNESDFYDVNVVGTTNLLTAIAEKKNSSLKKVLLISSSNVYGNCPMSPISEFHVPKPVNHYAMSKLAMEYMAHTFTDRLPIVLARPFNYTGRGQTQNFIIPKLVRHYSQKAKAIELGNTNVEREFNDVRTICDTYLSLLLHGELGETYNVCSGKPYTLQKVMTVLSELTGHVIQVKTNPTLVRVNEVSRLCGDPSKLQELFSKSDITLKQFELSEMLQWMLKETNC